MILAPCSPLHAPCSTHMSKHLERDLEALEHEILDQSSRVEEMIAKACQALIERRSDIANEVIANELEINVREVEIEEDCLKILALHQPVVERRAGGGREGVEVREEELVVEGELDLEGVARRHGQLDAADRPADLGAAPPPPDEAPRGRLDPDRALPRRLHRYRSRPPGLLHLHGRDPALFRRNARG